MLLFFTNASKSCKHSKWNICFFLNILLLKKGSFSPYVQQHFLWQPNVTQPELWWRQVGFPCTACACSVAFIYRGAYLYLPFLLCPILWWKCQRVPLLRAVGSALGAWLTVLVTIQLKTVPEGGIRLTSSLLGYSYSSSEILSFFFDFHLFSIMLIHFFIAVCLDLSYDIIDCVHSTLRLWSYHESQFSGWRAV